VLAPLARFEKESRVTSRARVIRDSGAPIYVRIRTRPGKLQSRDDRDRAKVNASKEVTAPVNCVKCPEQADLSVEVAPRESRR